ncbi:MAG: hypothetical protein AAF478_03500 [Pseudomonadota bacterium]
MAFKKMAMSRSVVSSYADGAACSKYFYATTDAAATIAAAGYFNDAREQLAKGDVVECVADINGTPDRIHLLFDTVPATGDVTTSADTGAAGA